VGFEIRPSYNVAPQTFQPVVAFNRKTLEHEILQMRWGLVPYWPAFILRTGLSWGRIPFRRGVLIGT
jgi:putative SOS response-associated peptidase YedK